MYYATYRPAARAVSKSSIPNIRLIYQSLSSKIGLIYYLVVQFVAGFLCVKLRFSRAQISGRSSNISIKYRREQAIYSLKCILNNIRQLNASPSACNNSKSQNELFFETTIREFFEVLRRIAQLGIINLAHLS